MAELDKWEYFCVTIDSSTKAEEVKDFLQQRWPDWKQLPKHTPQAMMPYLNGLGDNGWELMHIQPVHDIGGELTTNASMTGTYFCVLKRRKLS